MVARQRLLDAFIDLADTLVDEFDLTDFSHTLVSTCVEILEVDAAGLMLADEREQLRVFATSSYETRAVELLELQHHEGPCLDAYRTGLQVTAAGQADAQRRWPSFSAALRAADFSRVHAIPMRLRGQVVGAMNLFRTRPEALSDRGLALAQGLADMATIGLLQERVVQDRQILAEQLRAALDDRVLIEQATGVLAGRHDVPIANALVAMRMYARRTKEPLTQVAVAVIDGTLNEQALMAT